MGCSEKAYMSINLKLFFNNLIAAEQTDKSMEDIVAFLQANSWFGSKPQKSDTQFYLSDDQVQIYTDHMIPFLRCKEAERFDKMESAFAKRFPETAHYFTKFATLIEESQETIFHVRDFLLYYLEKELFFLMDQEVEKLVGYAFTDLIKSDGDCLTFFMSWLKMQHKTAYRNEYIMEKRYTLNLGKQAYDIDEYLELLFYLYNDEYIMDNDMYLKACESKNYADTWLFLAVHFICALRQTDLERFGHPILNDDPQTVLNKIKDGLFTDQEARNVLMYVNYRFCLLLLPQNKTADTSGVPAIKFMVPASCEVHFGTLLAICEAHRLLNNVPDEVPLIRKISSYGQIKRYMGDEIGELFIHSDFRSRSANKSYLQAIFSLTGEVLSTDEGEPLYTKGYMLAALARSHKGSYGSYAETTATYLRDAKFSGLTPEYVARELFERGVLSFIPAMLLHMVTEGQFEKISIGNQTMMIRQLGLSPREVEHVVTVCDAAHKKSISTVQALISSNSSTDLLTVLHRIGSGAAFSKRPEYLCLKTAFGRMCDTRNSCSGCSYEVSTKSSFFLLISEFNRMKNLYKNADSKLEKMKYKTLITDIIIPKLDEMLTCIRTTYGDDMFSDYEKLLKEYT